MTANSTGEGRGLLYRLYSSRLRRRLTPETVPHHVAMMIDGNRRWARASGATTAHGHRAGASKVAEFVGWCEDAGVEVVTVWLLSTENLNRPSNELDPLLEIIEETVSDLAASKRWRIHPVGALDLLPDSTARTLKEAADAPNLVSTLLSSAFNAGIAVGAAIGSLVLSAGWGYERLPWVSVAFGAAALIGTLILVGFDRRKVAIA